MQLQALAGAGDRHSLHHQAHLHQALLPLAAGPVQIVNLQLQGAVSLQAQHMHMATVQMLTTVKAMQLRHLVAPARCWSQASHKLSIQQGMQMRSWCQLHLQLLRQLVRHRLMVRQLQLKMWLLWVLLYLRVQLSRQLSMQPLCQLKVRLGKLRMQLLCQLELQLRCQLKVPLL